MVKNIDGVRPSRRSGVVAALIFVSIAATTVVPGVVQPAPAAALLQECRPLSSLNIQGQILSAATVIIPQTGPWRIRLTLNTSRHNMLCDSDFYCTTQGLDKCAFRPPLSLNISSIEVVSGASPFPNCQLVWDITPINASADVGFGFKLKYQEDVVGSGGSGINPKERALRSPFILRLLITSMARRWTYLICWWNRPTTVLKERPSHLARWRRIAAGEVYYAVVRWSIK